MKQRLRLMLLLGSVALLVAPALAANVAVTRPDAPQPLLLVQQEASPPANGVPEADEGDIDDNTSDEGEDYAPFPRDFVFPRIPVAFPQSAEAPGLVDFVTSLKVIVEKRDEAALLATVAPKIFWDRDFGGGFDENRNGVENFKDAMQIGVPDILPEYADDGWKRLSGLLGSTRFSTEADSPDAYCTPVFPTLVDAAAAEPTFEKVDMGEDGWQLMWGYVEGKAEARDKPTAEGAVVASVEDEALPVYSWGIEENVDWVDVGLPDGRRGFIDMHKVGSWVNERICFGQEAGKWAITGYVGGGD